MESKSELYSEYGGILQKAADINNAAAVLGWDQETYMPPKSAERRGEQLATLASMAHELLTSDKLGELLTQLPSDATLTDTEQANVRLSRRDMDKNKKLTSSFVESMSRQSSECFNAWIEARKKNDYSIYEPSLAKMIALKREQAALYGYESHPYDALLDDYEQGATVAMLDKVFEKIREQLPPILANIRAAQQVSNECFHQYFPKQAQWDFSVEVLK